MRSFFVWLFVLFVILSTAVFYYISSPQNQANISHLLPDNSSVNSILTRIQQEVLTPPPLTGSLTDKAGTLTINGVLQETNQHRATNGQPKLNINQALNQAAQSKLESMFNQQYFEHVAPDGTGPADLVDRVGYQYIRVGENLALGNYQNDADLVQAWMDSPGHRKNILSPGFSEIGIAVGQGQFQEHNTWLAVQTFGLPNSACPNPDPTLQNNFDQKKSALNTLSEELSTKKSTFSATDAIIENLRTEISNLSDEGNEKINAGNTLVEQENEKINAGDSTASNNLQKEGQKLQQKGETLIQQAIEKQNQLQQIAEEQNQSRATYNQQIVQFNELNKKIISIVKKINLQITDYNSCVELYK